MFQIQKSISECISVSAFATVGPNEMVASAVEAMAKTDVDCALVIDGDKLVGIFTERDFLNRVSAANRDPATTPMREVMTTDVRTLQGDDCVTYAIDRMANGGFRNVPILDENGKPKAVLDVRVVMGHLVKVFAEIEKEDPEVGQEWIDIGGGG